MNFLKKIGVEWMLRLGLGAMYVYSGQDFIFNPQHWYGFTPQWLSRVVIKITTMDNYLRFQGGVELGLGLVLLAWFLGPKIVSLVAVFGAAEMFLILVFVGVDPITFRDLGLLGGFLALFLTMSGK